MLFALLDMFMKEMADTTAVVCDHQGTDQRFAKYSNNLSYNPRHISWDSTDIFCLLNVGFFELAS